MLTQAELLAIEQRAEKATKGPWTCKNTLSGMTFIKSGDEQVAILSGPSYAMDDDFIAHARTDIPALLSHIKALENQVRAKDEALSAKNRALEVSAELLDEVHTGEDFECRCWGQAIENRHAINLK